VAVRALVFDVFGTLVDWRSGIAEAFRASGVPGDPDELADAWRERYVPIMLEVNNRVRRWANFDQLHHVTLDDLLAERDLDLDPGARGQLVAAWHRLDPWPDVRDALELLRRSHVVATLSNGHLALLVDLVRHGDLRFDCLLSAELAGAYKPASQVYRTAPRFLGIKTSEVMMVASHPADLWGARRAGLRSAFIDRPLEYGPGSPPRQDPEADVSVSDLRELAKKLDRARA
jgi:2-haloacid dehalogenase